MKYSYSKYILGFCSQTWYKQSNCFTSMVYWFFN